LCSVSTTVEAEHNMLITFASSPIPHLSYLHPMHSVVAGFQCASCEPINLQEVPTMLVGTQCISAASGTPWLINIPWAKALCAAQLVLCSRPSTSRFMEWGGRPNLTQIPAVNPNPKASPQLLSLCSRPSISRHVWSGCLWVWLVPLCHGTGPSTTSSTPSVQLSWRGMPSSSR